MASSAARIPIRSVRWVDRTAIVEAAGEIKLDIAVRFQEKLFKLLARKPQRVVVDLGAVGHMDSSGVASLVKLVVRCRRMGAPVYLVGLQPRVRSVMEITRLDAVFDIRQTVEEALA